MSFKVNVNIVLIVIIIIITLYSNEHDWLKICVVLINIRYNTKKSLPIFYVTEVTSLTSVV